MPIRIGKYEFKSIQHVYLCSKFSYCPDIQQEIYDMTNFTDIQQTVRQHESKISRSFENNKYKIMFWCLQLKMIQYWNEISEVMDTIDTKRQFIHISHRDKVWGTIPVNSSKSRFFGRNIMGLMWKNIHRSYKTNGKGEFHRLTGPICKHFYFFNESVPFFYNLEPHNSIMI